MSRSDCQSLSVTAGTLTLVSGRLMPLAVFSTPPDLHGPELWTRRDCGECVIAAGITTARDAASLVAGITLVSGVLYLAVAALRMGCVAQLVSRPATSAERTPGCTPLPPGLPGLSPSRQEVGR